MSDPVLIVGASLGGLRTAEHLRKNGYLGAITIIGEEKWKPYNRPPLSKAVLAGVVSHEAVAFEERAQIADVDWVLGTRAIQVDTDKHEVLDETNRIHKYSHLVIATGLRAKKLHLENGGLAGRFTLRTLDDAIALREVMKTGARLVIIGGGFIGCEVAATALKLGCDVSIVHNSSHPMLRPLGVDLAKQMQEIHEEAGVKFFLKRTAVGLIGDTKIDGVTLDDGSYLPCDVLVEAVGSLANTEWLQNSAIDIRDGVLVDSAMRAIDSKGAVVPDVFAVGDLARFQNLLFDEIPRRVEHWNIPTETAKRAASVIAASFESAELLGRITNSEFLPIPSFWSDQYETHLLSFGLLALADRVLLVAGSPRSECVYEYYRGEQLVGVCGIGMRSIIQSYRARFK